MDDKFKNPMMANKTNIAAALMTSAAINSIHNISPGRIIAAEQMVQSGLLSNGPNKDQTIKHTTVITAQHLTNSKYVYNTNNPSSMPGNNGRYYTSNNNNNNHHNRNNCNNHHDHHHHLHHNSNQDMNTNRSHSISHNKQRNNPKILTKTAPMEQLTAIHAKATSARTKNEEAIMDLRTRIPEIENIFDIHNRIGNGTFSTVLLGTLKKERHIPEIQKRKFAIKHHIPTSHPDRIMKELHCMAKIGGTDNVVGINCCIRYNESVAFIMPYLAHDRFHDFFSKMDVDEVQFYMKNLLIALRHVHKFNVIHRDVKPSNFLYNRRKRQFLLVDFGLAQQIPNLTSQSSTVESKNNNNCTKYLNDKHCNAKLSAPCDGKRPREPDNSVVQTANRETIEVGDTIVVTGGECISGGAKRQRCHTPGEGNDMNIIEAAGNSKANEKTKPSNHTQKQRIKAGADVTSSIANNNSNAYNNTNSNTAVSNKSLNDTLKYKTNRNVTISSNTKCHCYGNPQVCNTCLVKKEIHASRAGTPGYRPPEVLLKYPDQTTAVDVWAAGVIFLSIMSSVYPFFKAPNDYVALAEMVTIFGDKTIRRTAYLLDRLVTLSQRTKPLDLRKLCVRFRNRAKFSSPELLKKYQRNDGSCEICKNCDQFHFNCLCADTNFVTEPFDGDDLFPPSAYDLLGKLLEVNPHKRITAEEALHHPFFTEFNNINNRKMITTTSNAKQGEAITPNVITSCPTGKTANQVTLANNCDSGRKIP